MFCGCKLHTLNSSEVCQFWKKRWRHDSIVLLKTRKNRKNNRKKQGSFFPSLFQVSSFNIRATTGIIASTTALIVVVGGSGHFGQSYTKYYPFSLLFECQGKFPATFRQLKATVFKWPSTPPPPPSWRASNAVYDICRLQTAWGSKTVNWMKPKIS